MKKTVDKYQVVFTNGNKTNAAGSKAPSDVAAVAESSGFIPLNIDVAYKYTDNRIRKFFYILKSVFQWLCLYFRIKKDSVLLSQSPMVGGGKLRNRILGRLKEKKNVRLVFLVHDVEKLRYDHVGKSEEEEFEFMLSSSSVIIVHNESMKKWFIANENYPEEKLVVLKIFDYLYPVKEENVAFEKAVSIAGNLSLSKSRYLSHLKENKTKFYLYGPNYSDEISSDNIVYRGSFPPDDIPYLLKSGFGLIWDGTESDTCSGEYGNYLRYNNPHKLSLYLASGLPVFIWEEAAEAQFVIGNNVGFAIGSLREIDSILSSLDEETYRNMSSNAHLLALRLSSGEFVRTALFSALECLERKTDQILKTV